MVNELHLAWERSAFKFHYHRGEVSAGLDASQLENLCFKFHFEFVSVVHILFLACVGCVVMLVNALDFAVAKVS